MLQPQISSYEAEQASNAYLMSLVAIVVGVPLPIINLLATIGFCLSHRASTYFVRWHCLQALLGQVVCFLFNSIGFWWTVNIIFLGKQLSIGYFAYMSIVIFINLVEMIITIYTAIETRKSKNIRWRYLDKLVDRICKP